MSRAHRTCDFHRIRLKQRPPSRAIPRPTIRPSSGRVVRRSTHPGHWPRRLVCPLVGSHRCRLSVGSPDHVSNAFAPGHWPGIRPVIHDDQLEALALLPWFPAAFRPPAFASRPSCSRPGVELSSRSADRTQGSGPRRGFRVSHARAAIGVGALSTPETTVLILTGVAHRPALVASQRHVPTPRHNHHRCGALLHEASTEGSSTSPVRSSPRL